MTNFNTNNSSGGATGPHGPNNPGGTNGPGGAGSGQQQSPSFRDTLSAIWRTRPYRLPKEDGSRAWISGVCEGIAVRYQVDPLLIRIAFAGLAFAGGLGIALYAAAVLVLPRRGVEQAAGERLLTWEIPADPTPGGEARRATLEAERRTAVIALVVLALCIVAGVSILQAGSLIVLAAVGAAVWFLYKRTPTQPEVMQHFKIPAGFEGVRARTPGGADAADFIGPEVPPAWDPLGDSPFAWNQPDPASPDPASPDAASSESAAPGAARAAGGQYYGSVYDYGVDMGPGGGAGAGYSGATVPGAAPGAGAGSGRKKRKSKKSRAWRIVVGLLLGIVTIGGAVLLYMGVNQNEDDDVGAITVGPLSAEQPDLDLSYQGMQGRAVIYPESFEPNDPSQRREMSLTFTASTVDVELPGYTAGPSYWLDLECSTRAGTIGGDGCSEISPVFVPGNYGADLKSGKEKPEELKGKLPRIKLKLKADDAVVDVHRGELPGGSAKSE